MTEINWDVTTSYKGIPLPTYGNYGGFNYTAGEVGGITPQLPTDGSAPSPAPVDWSTQGLDTQFYYHDLVYQNTNNPNKIAQADVTLVENLYTLAPTDAEAQLYDGLATLAVIYKIETTRSEVNYLNHHPLDVSLADVTETAIQNIETGFAHLSPAEAFSALQFASSIFTLGGTLLGNNFGNLSLQANVTDGGGGTDNFVFNADFGKTTALNHQDVLAFDQNVFGVQQTVDHAHDISTAVQQVLDHAHDTTVGFVAPDVGGVNVADLHSHSFHFV
jgi:hypothetical protein